MRVVSAGSGSSALPRSMRAAIRTRQAGLCAGVGPASVQVVLSASESRTCIGASRASQLLPDQVL